MLTMDQKGATAELTIARAAVRLGIDVYRPLQEGGRYDLIFDLGDRLDRVQCKWAPLQDEVVVVRAYSTRRTADGLRRRPCAAGEIDALAAYCPSSTVASTFPPIASAPLCRYSFASPRAGTTRRRG
jgi:hypothetical protein